VRTLQEDGAGPVHEAEAGVEAGSRLEEWQRDLLGTYAAKGYAFSESTFGLIAMSTDLSFVHIVEADGGVELSVEMCTETVSSRLAELSFVHPETLPVRRHQVMFEPGQQWRTETPLMGTGYDLEVPDKCRGFEGSSVAKDPAQTWITETPTCKCPASRLAPPELADCRITDPDGDLQPGYTLTLRSKEAIASVLNAEVHGATANSSHYLHGRINRGGFHSAEIVLEVETYQLSCRPSSCADLSSDFTQVRACPPQRNTVSFVPLDLRTEPAGGWSCDAIRNIELELFPGLDPAPPATCD
jgi:hypothetical protein